MKRGKMHKNILKILTILTLLLATCLGIVSSFGIFDPSVYQRDAASMAAQGVGQDIVNLFLIAPLLIISLLFIHKGNRIAINLFGGIIFYILYSFIIYSLGVHFNKLFFWYCTTLGLSLYTFIIFIYSFSKLDINSWYTGSLPVRSTATFLVIIAILFYLLWLKEVIPAILTDTVPQTVSEYQLLVNPVHVIDISFALPGLIITAFLLVKKHKLGYILAPISLVFIILLTIALIGMIGMLKYRGISDDTSITFIFIILTIISGMFLIQFLKNIKFPE
jgi:hypothetical protein